MSALAVVDWRRRAADLASAGLHELEQMEGDLQSMAAHAVKLGNILAEAKGLLPHGQWLPWLEERLPIAERTAQRYMLMAEQAAEDPTRVSDMTIRAVRRGTLTPTLHEEKPPEPKDTATKAMLGNLDTDPTVDATVVEDRPARMADRAQRKWLACRSTATEIGEQILITDEQSDQSWASTFRDASKRARSLAVELEALAEAVERQAA